MFLLDNGLLNGGISFATPKMLLIMLTGNSLLLTPLLMIKLKLQLTPSCRQLCLSPLQLHLLPHPLLNLLSLLPRPKKKKYDFDGLSKSTLIALLKQQWKDEEEAVNANSEEEEDGQELGAFLKATVANTNPY